MAIHDPLWSGKLTPVLLQRIVGRSVQEMLRWIVPTSVDQTVLLVVDLLVLVASDSLVREMVTSIVLGGKAVSSSSKPAVRRAQVGGLLLGGALPRFQETKPDWLSPASDSRTLIFKGTATLKKEFRYAILHQIK